MVFTTTRVHPGVNYLYEQTHAVYLGGSIEGVELPDSFGFGAYRRTPRQQREVFTQKGWRKVIAYQTSKIIHRLQRELLVSTAKEQQAQLLLHPTIGSTKPRDTHYYTRILIVPKILAY